MLTPSLLRGSTHPPNKSLEWGLWHGVIFVVFFAHPPHPISEIFFYHKTFSKMFLLFPLEKMLRLVQSGQDFLKYIKQCVRLQITCRKQICNQVSPLKTTREHVDVRASWLWHATLWITGVDLADLASRAGVLFHPSWGCWPSQRGQPSPTREGPIFSQEYTSSCVPDWTPNKLSRDYLSGTSKNERTVRTW